MFHGKPHQNHKQHGKSTKIPLRNQNNHAITYLFKKNKEKPDPSATPKVDPPTVDPPPKPSDEAAGDPGMFAGESRLGGLEYTNCFMYLCLRKMGSDRISDFFKSFSCVYA